MNFTKVTESLQKNGFQVSCFETAEEASKYLNEQIDGKTVGIGGSITLKDMGMYESLGSHNTVHWHWYVPEGKTGPQVLADAAAAQVYMSSVNGLAETGEIINIDGTCNRVASIYYGHEKVYLVAGKNKIAADYGGALYRARNVASPLNAQRLNRKTPCAVKGDKCYDCKSEERICRGLSVLWEKPGNGQYEVVLINEELGY